MATVTIRSPVKIPKGPNIIPVADKELCAMVQREDQIMALHRSFTRAALVDAQGNVLAYFRIIKAPRPDGNQKIVGYLRIDTADFIEECVLPTLYRDVPAITSEARDCEVDPETKALRALELMGIGGIELRRDRA